MVENTNSIKGASYVFGVLHLLLRWLHEFLMLKICLFELFCNEIISNLKLNYSNQVQVWYVCFRM